MQRSVPPENNPAKYFREGGEGGGGTSTAAGASSFGYAHLPYPGPRLKLMATFESGTFLSPTPP